MGVHSVLSNPPMFYSWIQSSKIGEHVLKPESVAWAESKMPAPIGQGRKELGSTAEAVALSPLGTIDPFETLHIAHIYVKFCI